MGDSLWLHGIPPPTPGTSCFRVYKLIDSISSSWVEVKTIWDDVLFLGLNASLSVSSLPFPAIAYILLTHVIDFSARMVVNKKMLISI